jgi:two-component system, OmpR family, sensor kinase
MLRDEPIFSELRPHEECCLGADNSKDSNASPGDPAQHDCLQPLPENTSLMKGLFWRLFAVFSLAFVAIDACHSYAVRLIHESGVVAGADRVEPHADPLVDTLAAYGAALPIALVLSAFLAWYLNRPIRVMRSAFGAMSAGRLDTRVRHLLRSRRDDIADLGRDFDGMAHRLEGLVALRQTMLRDVSHELRSPLARLQTAIGLAQQNPDNILETLDRIESESMRLQVMLENMLTLAQMETGTESMAREEVDLIELVAAIARDARFEALARGCDLVFRAEGLCIGTVHVELLHRAFENVIRNAVKYTATGTCVEVAVAYDGALLRATIADRGPGVAVAELTRIFEPFYRAVQPGQPRAPGFGVGLAIARRAVEYHGGSIEAGIREGGGLVVSIVLHVAESPMESLLS